jgi:hypothetical protein
LDEEDLILSSHKVVEETLLSADLVVCDEGHRIKNSAANIAKSLQRIHTKRRIVLTGYPLQNNLIEYWCMVDFVRPSYLGTKAEFCNMFERPIMNGQCMDSTRDDLKLMRYRAHVLHSLLEGFVQRRGHDVFLSSLPKKYEYIILLKLSAVQKELYLAFMESIGAMQPGEKVNPLRSFAICCKIWNHPDVLHKFNCDKEDADTDLDLPGLQNQKPKPKVNPNPNTPNVHLNPIYSGFNPFGNGSNQSSSSSSSSRPGLDPNWSAKIMDPVKYEPGCLENGAKFLLSFSLIEESVLSGDKILLFSQSLLSLNLIEEYLHKLDVPGIQNPKEKWAKYKSYYRLDGSTSGVERERLINLFNRADNQAMLFLLSTRAGCLGINLIGANRVIVLDASWNPCHDAQAVCRVFRYGQQKNCFIYRLIADHTMEKKIYDRQISKQTMSDRVIDEIQAENHFTRTEVEKLIHYVKEDMPSADLTQIAQKLPDHVLIRSCMKNAKFITKEPFTHESLLIDKKEYKLSEREKQLAIREYQHDKRYFPYNSNSRSNQNQNQNQNVSSANYAQILNLKYPNYNNNNNLPRPGLIGSNGYNYNYPQVLHHSQSYPGLLQQQQQQQPYHIYRGNNNNNNNLDFNLLNNNNNMASSSSSSSSDLNHPTIMKYLSSNESDFVCSTTMAMTMATTSTPSPKLSDVKISCFIAPSEIVIPSEEEQQEQEQEQQDNRIVIRPGEKVYILKTPKGCYLRTQDKRYIALGNRSLEESFMPLLMQEDNYHQQQQQQQQQVESSSFNIASTSNCLINNLNNSSSINNNNNNYHSQMIMNQPQPQPQQQPQQPP